MLILSLSSPIFISTSNDGSDSRAKELKLQVCDENADKNIENILRRR